MLFNSYLFIFIFLPITICIYYLAGRFGKATLSKAVLLIVSYVFVAYANPWYLLILLISTSVNYIFNRWIYNKTSGAKTMLIIGIVFNVALLGYFKYTNFLNSTKFFEFF